MPQKTTKGATVTVYNKYMTEEQPEGQAKLLKKIDEEAYDQTSNIERWQVRFTSDGFKAERFILAEK